MGVAWVAGVAGADGQALLGSVGTETSPAMMDSREAATLSLISWGISLSSCDP
jgi:hypothetical protein